MSSNRTVLTKHQFVYFPLIKHCKILRNKEDIVPLIKILMLPRYEYGKGAEIREVVFSWLKKYMGDIN